MSKRHHKSMAVVHSTPTRPTTVATDMAARATKPNRSPASEEGIRMRAYQKWEAAGHPPGDGIQFWLEAERELLNGA